MFNNFKKVIRFMLIYGIRRTLTKVSGRKRDFNFNKPIYFKKKPAIGLIGCGQFQFSTIAYFLSNGYTNRFLFCYDSRRENAASLAKYYSIPNLLENYDDIFMQENTHLVYIASNHATHSQYAREFLEKNIDVFCEKPISVTFEQFDLLLRTIRTSTANFFAGYNRPHASATREIKAKVKSKNIADGKFSLNCFISAHIIPEGHWYRESKEGTRICGNVGHWLDLMVHMYNWRGYIPKKYNVNIAYSNGNEPDDNISISITTPEGDLASFMITARSEPYEGINESINFQYDSIIAKIDDFRRLTIWDKDKYYMKRFYPKDVGHRDSVMQPFENINRDLNEVISSTELMLHIAEMVNNTVSNQKITLTRKL
jgi:predicted dehydrogenase